MFFNQPADELEACFHRLKNMSLTLVDVSNYVPGDTDVCDGSPPASGSICEYHLPPAIAEMAQSILGDDFTGMDNGDPVGVADGVEGAAVGLADGVEGAAVGNGHTQTYTAIRSTHPPAQ